MKKILVMDDELGVIESLKAIFHQCYDVYTANSVDEVFKVLEENRIELLLLDIILPKGGGLEILRELRQRYPETPVIMLRAVSSTSTIAEAIRIGAVEFITKPFDVNDVRVIADKAIQTVNERRQVEASRREAIETGFLHEMPGESLVYRNFLHEIRRLAANEEPAVLVGERGTGKDTIARLIHTLSVRSELPFIKAQHSPGREDAFEREFFGQDLEAAVSVGNLRELGKLDLVGSGTMYVEDLDLLPVSTQKRLGALIEGQSFMRDGGILRVQTTSRLLFSVSSSIDQSVPELFDERLSAIASGQVLRIPALRERREDIPLLAYAIINRLRSRMQLAVKDIDVGAMEVLRRYDWPGNARELENILEGVLFIHPKINVIKIVHLPQEIQWNRSISPKSAESQQFELGTLEERTDAFQRSLIIEALNEARGIKSRAAELLGTTPRILSYRIDQLNIDHQELEPKGRMRFMRHNQPSESKCEEAVASS